MSEFTNEYFNKGEHFIGAQFGTELVSGGDTYTGYFLNGLKHGYGILQYSSGDILEGIWEEGLINETESTYTWKSGSKYVGGFKNDEMNGYGKFTNTVGEYEGDWHDGVRHGEGSFIHSNGMTYSGQWSNDQKNGEGEYTSPQGSIYVGSFMNDNKHG